MTLPAARSLHDMWLEQGSQAALPVRGYHALAVLGENGNAAAAVARGIASAVAHHRRVIVADLVGAVPALRDLSTEADPEGVEESFDFGISLAKVARQTPVQNFMLIPSASDSVAREEIFRSGRWTRLARQCRAAGWLLIAVARVSAPGVAALVEQLDGAVLLPGAEPAGGVRVLHRLQKPAHQGIAPIGRVPLLVGAASVLLALVVGIGLWRTYAAPPPAARSAAVRPSTVQPEAADDRLGFAAFNPTDSIAAAAYAVEMMSANTRAGANLELRRTRAVYPAATLGAATVGASRATWFRLIAGAFGEPRQADSLLRAARGAGAVSGTGGAVIRAPFALLVDSAGSPAASRAVLDKYLEREVPAYALVQPDGRVLVYVGAFVVPHESVTFTEELSGSGSRPVLVYRTGRVF